MKTDIEKIKAEYEEKIQNAIEANGIIDYIGDDSLCINIMGRSYEDKSKKRLYIRPDNFRKELTIEQAGMILSKYPVTQKTVIDKNNAIGLEFDYDASISRSYNDRCSYLEIDWFSGEYELSVKLAIEGNEMLNGYFTDTTRAIDPIEIRTHYVVSRPNRRAADVRIPIKVFANGEYIRYQMGHVRSTSEYAVINIVDTIKECYFKSVGHEEVCQ